VTKNSPGRKGKGALINPASIRAPRKREGNSQNEQARRGKTRRRSFISGTRLHLEQDEPATRIFLFVKRDYRES